MKNKKGDNNMRVSDAIVEYLIKQNVEVVFGVPGDTSMSFHNSFEKYKDKINYVSCRDERHAAYMADTFSRVSGKPGVVDVPSGGGLLYAIPGLSEATSSSIPIICFSSDIAVSSQGTGALTELKQQELTNTVTKWNDTIIKPEKALFSLQKAFRISQSGRPGAVHISIPEDIHESYAEFNSEDFYVPVLNKFINAPQKQDVDKAIELIKQAKRPAIIAGGGAHLSKAYDNLEKLSTEYNIPVATSLNGKGSLAEHYRQSIGVIGVNGGSKETNEIIQKADLVINLGTKLNNVTTVAGTIYQNNPKLIQVDTSEEILYLNIKPDLAIMADINEFLSSLFNNLDKYKKEIVEKTAKWMKEVDLLKTMKKEKISKEVNTNTKLVNPAKIIDNLNNITNENSVFVVDAGTQNPYMAANYITKRSGRTTVFDRGHGNLGYALGASLGAEYAKQNSQVFSMIGDGSFAMAVGELETVKRLNLPIIFLHFQNNSYGWIKKLHQLYYDEKYIGVDFGELDGEKIAEGFGIKNKKVKNNDELLPALEWAIKQKAPVFLDLIIEPITDIVPPVTNWKEDADKDPKDRVALTY